MPDLEAEDDRPANPELFISYASGDLGRRVPQETPTTEVGRLGTALNDLGLMSPEKVQQTLRAQIEDTICDLFLWERGVFLPKLRELAAGLHRLIV